MEEYKKLIKSNALFKMDALIRYFHFDYNNICSFITERSEEYFTKEEANEISITVNGIINSQERFEMYCRDQGLMQ